MSAKPQAAKTALGPPAGNCYIAADSLATNPGEPVPGGDMKRSAALLLLLVSGCSTAPIADLLDFFKPGCIGPEKTAPYGGVCIPQSIAPPAGIGPCVVPPPPPPGGAPVAAPIGPPPPPPPVVAAPPPVAPPPVAAAPPPVAPTPGPEAADTEERIEPDLGSAVGRPRLGIPSP
jgi:hypothetical protein